MPVAKRTVRIAVVLTALAPLLSSGCGSEETFRYGDSRLGHSESPLTLADDVPRLDFYANHGAATDIALTFDDGPDGEGSTDRVLDVLASKGVKAAFFINTANAVDVNSSSAARNTVQRIAADGHELVNHSVHHYDWNTTSVDVESEIAGVEAVFGSVAPAALNERLVRAPFGNPYFGPQSRLDTVAPIVARHGVHVGWDIDSLDWQCSAGGKPATCVRDNVMAEIDKGNHGIVLLHSINALTVSALPGLIDALRARGMRFVSVESMVVAKYGKPSRELIGGSGGMDAGTDSPAADAGGGDSIAPVGASTATVACSSVTVTSGALNGTSANRCTSLATENGVYVLWNAVSGPAKSSAYATYVSPYGSGVSAMYLDVSYNGDDRTEPLWQWSIRDVATGAWVAVGDNAWAGNWVRTSHTFTISNPTRYIDASGKIDVRFTTASSTNLAELDKMVVRVVASDSSDAGADTAIDDTSTTDTATTDTATTDTATTDTATTDTATTDTSVSDTAPADTGSTDMGSTDTDSTDSAPVVETITCSSFTTTSGSFYGSKSTACSGTTPSLATANGTLVGWIASTTSTKASAYATYSLPTGVTALTLNVRYRGDGGSAPPWHWSARNVLTGAWDVIGDTSFAKSWSYSAKSFVIASPEKYIRADGKIDIRFTTTTSTNDAELDRMVLVASRSSG